MVENHQGERNVFDLYVASNGHAEHETELETELETFRLCSAAKAHPACCSRRQSQLSQQQIWRSITRCITKRDSSLLRATLGQGTGIAGCRTRKERSGASTWFSGSAGAATIAQSECGAERARDKSQSNILVT
eukprot:3934146-Rhodomonas_salina.1